MSTRADGASSYMVRPPGHGVDSRKVHRALPKKLRTKIKRRTVIRRLAEKGYVPDEKVNKQDPGPTLCKKRVDLCDAHRNRTGSQWKEHLQGCGDFKEFTFYPPDLKPRHKQLRAGWTYMKKGEKYKKAFVRPKRWFKKKDYKRTLKCKVFGLTTSSGKVLSLAMPKTLKKEDWAKILKAKVIPFLRRQFPDRRQIRVLLDGEKIMRAKENTKLMKDAGVIFLEDWVAHSPELNPQENVWPIAEKILRDLESDNDTFEDFQAHCVEAVKAYEHNSGAKKLVSSMSGRIRECLDNKGAMIAR